MSEEKQTAKHELMERLKSDMAPEAAKIFREARHDAYSSGDWIMVASREVVDQTVDRVFGILHQVAQAQEQQEKKGGGK